MNVGELVISAGALSSLLLEGIKLLVRKLMKNETYDFPVAFYVIMLPVLNAVMPFFMQFVLGMSMSDPILSMDLVGVLRYVALIVIGALISLVTHSTAVVPFRTYARCMKEQNEQKEWEKAVQKAIEETE